MLDLAIYGAGGLGREMALLIKQINQVKPQWRLLGFYDDKKQIGELIDGVKVLGGINELNKIKEPLAVMLAIADSAVRESLTSKITNANISYPVIAHPNSLVGSPTNKFGVGCIITAGCILTTGIELGDFVIVNLSSTIGHDVKVGSFTSIMPGCNISGNVTIGKRTLIGTGAQILQSIKVGDDCKVGAGAVVTKSFGNNVTVVGVPAKER